MWVTKQLLDHIDFHNMGGRILWESIGPINLLTDIFQNNFFCVQQKKDIHTGLE